MSHRNQNRDALAKHYTRACPEVSVGKVGPDDWPTAPLLRSRVRRFFRRHSRSSVTTFRRIGSEACPAESPARGTPGNPRKSPIPGPCAAIFDRYAPSGASSAACYDSSAACFGSSAACFHASAVCNQRSAACIQSRAASNRSSARGYGPKACGEHSKARGYDSKAIGADPKASAEDPSAATVDPCAGASGSKVATGHPWITRWSHRVSAKSRGPAPQIILWSSGQALAKAFAPTSRQPVEQAHCVLRRYRVSRDDLHCGASNVVCQFRITQQLENRAFEFRGIRNLNGSVALEERLRHCVEILHEWAEEHRATRSRRLHGILSTPLG
jgi:hypothetical protein